MASSSSSTTKLSLKLLIDTKKDKVLFAGASKSVIDFLFNLLYLPISTIVKLLTTNGMVGSLGNLYQSVENLNQNYMQSNQTKDILLNPRPQSSSTQIYGILTHNNDSGDEDDDVDKERTKKGLRSDSDSDSDYDEDNDDKEGTKLYMCPHKCGFRVAYDRTTICPGPHSYGYGARSNYMNREVSYVGNKKVAEKKFYNIKNGFVKDVVTFMVMDDLVIQPMSTISSITLLNKFNVKEIGTLQEKVVELGMNEGIKLLKASLQSKMVLTSVFLKKKY